MSAPRDDPGGMSAGSPVGGAPTTALFLISPSTTPCGIEAFARRLAHGWDAIGERSACLAVSGRGSDLAAIWTALGGVEALVVNCPVVAWKTVIATPLAALVMALARGKTTILVLHEWDDLDWRRRAILRVYARFARRILVSSPIIAAQFERGALSRWREGTVSTIPIPANIELPTSVPPTPLALRVRAEREAGKLVIGHFGSIYPNKQADFVLDVAAALKRVGRPVFATFVGAFIKARDTVEADFHAKVRALGLQDDILVTGYVETQDDIAAIFAEIDCFLYRFKEGLTSRRGSVLACVQTGKPVIVNAPSNTDEFAHHPTYRAALASGGLCLIDTMADAAAYAARLAAGMVVKPATVTVTFADGWRNAALALRTANRA